MTHGQLTALIVDDPIDAWKSIGFEGDDVVKIGSTTIVGTAAGERRHDGKPKGILGASIDGLTELDGLQLGSWVETEGAPDAPDIHPNGVVAIDHVVLMTPDSDRTTANFEAQNIEARRVRKIETPDGPRRQTFFWLGDVICEVVGPDEPVGDRPAKWWGLALTVHDLEKTVAVLGDMATPIKDAVQPGRRVSTLERQAGVSVPILFISPHV